MPKPYRRERRDDVVRVARARETGVTRPGPRVHDDRLAFAEQRGRTGHAFTTTVLAASVPALMQQHLGHGWRLVCGDVPGEDLVIEVFPSSAPERCATVQVDPGVEVFRLRFAGHESADFAYADADRVEALRGRLELAVAATAGPTCVTVHRAGTQVVRSTMTIDPGGVSAREDSVTRWPLRRMAARLHRRPVTRHVIEFPAAPEAD